MSWPNPSTSRAYYRAISGMGERSVDDRKSNPKQIRQTNPFFAAIHTNPMTSVPPNEPNLARAPHCGAGFQPADRILSRSTGRRPAQPSQPIPAAANQTQIAKMPNEPNFHRNSHKSNDFPATKRTHFRSHLSLSSSVFIRVHLRPYNLTLIPATPTPTETHFRPLPPKPHPGDIMFADPEGPVSPWLP